MEPPSSVVAESKPQPASPPSPAQPDSEARYQRRSAFLNHPRTKWGLILAGLVIVIGIFFLWRYLTSYESTDDAQVDGHVNRSEEHTSELQSHLNLVCRLLL